MITRALFYFITSPNGGCAPAKRYVRYWTLAFFILPEETCEVLLQNQSFFTSGENLAGLKIARLQLDIEAVLAMQDELDFDRIQFWVRQFAEALEMPELWAELEAVITKVKQRFNQ